MHRNINTVVPFTVLYQYIWTRQCIYCGYLRITTSQITITVHHIAILELSFSNICTLCISHSFRTAPKSSMEQMKLLTSRRASMQQITLSFRRIWMLNSISFHEGTREKVSECERMRERAIFKKHSPQVKSSHPSRQWQSQPGRKGRMRRGAARPLFPSSEWTLPGTERGESSPLLAPLWPRTRKKH